MSEKQDRQGARTVQDLEQKYTFGKKFSEILGLIDDSRQKVDSVESELRKEITGQATSITRNTEEIVMQAEQRLTTSISEVDGKVSEVEKQVAMKVSATDVTIAVREEMAGGVKLNTGYRFDSDGLTISKDGEAMKNLVDNTGMYVKKSGEPILSANEHGVDAANLHASTYLIVGAGEGRSRFEDYGTDRTGCFWVGG